MDSGADDDVVVDVSFWNRHAAESARSVVGAPLLRTTDLCRSSFRQLRVLLVVVRNPDGHGCDLAGSLAVLVSSLTALAASCHVSFCQLAARLKTQARSPSVCVDLKLWPLLASVDLYPALHDGSLMAQAAEPEDDTALEPTLRVAPHRLALLY